MPHNKGNKSYKGNRKKLKSLFKKYNGICCYCRCKTVLPFSGYNGTQPGNMATIEHIYDNYSLVRLLLKKWDKIKLACYSCNHSRHEETTLAHYIGYDYRERNEGLLISLLNIQNEKNF